jgi:hypothetical protein
MLRPLQPETTVPYSYEDEPYYDRGRLLTLNYLENLRPRERSVLGLKRVTIFSMSVGNIFF